MRHSTVVAALGFVCALLVPLSSAAAQTGAQLSGTVTNEAGRPLAGASVSIEGTRQGAVTRPDGRYAISGVEPGQHTVRASLIGYGERTQAVTVTAERPTMLDFQLRAQAVELEGVVAVGYGTQRARDVTGAVASVRVEDVPVATTVSVGQMLQGRVAGAQVVQNNGAPGTGISVRIRGTNSITANSEPLYVIDGVPAAVGSSSLNPYANPLASINPQDIESIEILKDASSTAIYGARGANGVVLITTRQGRRGEGRITLESSYGIQQPTRLIPLLNAQQYAQLANEARTNIGLAPLYTQAQIAEFGLGTDWQAAVVDNAPMQNHTLSFSGGDERTRYLISGNFTDQGGILRGTQFERYSGRINLDRSVNDRLQIGTNLTLSRAVSDFQFTDELNPGVTDAMVTTPPVHAVRDALGNFTVLPRGNPVAFQDEIRNLTTLAAVGNLFGEYEITDALRFRTSLGVNSATERSEYYAPRTTPNGMNASGVASISTGETLNLTNDNIVTYRREAGRGNLDLTTGVTWQNSRSRSLSAGASQFATDITGVHSLGSGALVATPGSGVSDWTILSYLGRANYSLLDRYLFTVTGRYDGSSRFGANTKWGFFPSAAFAWRLSEESFLRNQELFSDLKLRLSYGRTGNQEIGLYNSLARLASVSTTFGGARIIGYAPAGAAPNPDLRWESTGQFNAGLDIGWLDNRVTASLDAYHSVTTDLLLSVNLPSTSGYSSQLQNIGSVRNRGVEFSLSTINLERERVSWRSTLSLAANRNRVTDLGGVQQIFVGGEKGLSGQTGGNAGVIQVGEPLGNVLGYPTAGIFQAGDTCHLTVLRTNVDCVPGEYRYVDTNGDGRINANDRVIVGNGEPELFGGLNNQIAVGRFELSFFLQGSYGNRVLNGLAINTTRLALDMNQTTAALNRWSEQNTATDVPRANFQRPRAILDVHMEDASYLRLQNLTLGYDLPERLLPGANSARLFVTGQNLHVWTRYTGFDPEVNSFGGSTAMRGIDLGAYPRARSWTVGANVSF